MDVIKHHILLFYIIQSVSSLHLYVDMSLALPILNSDVFCFENSVDPEDNSAYYLISGDEIEPADGDKYENFRILFDITFFFFVIVILLAIIQGEYMYFSLNQIKKNFLWLSLV